MIVIIDYGMGNLRSVYNKFKSASAECLISSDKEEIKKADKLVLPGVGHFQHGMQKLHELDMVDTLNEKVINQKTPIFGICLGTQLFAGHSEEGGVNGLGWIDAKVVKFKVSDKIKYKIPHMGWNNVNIENGNSINNGIIDDDQFYFVHSYHLVCNEPSDVWMTSEYDYRFVSAVRRGNIYGSQFHPEKSHDAGFKLIKKFAEL